MANNIKPNREVVSYIVPRNQIDSKQYQTKSLLQLIQLSATTIANDTIKLLQQYLI